MFSDSENILKNNCKNIQLIILRLPIIYGKGALNSLMSKLMTISCLNALEDKKFKISWNADRKLYTIHIKDVSRAILYVICDNINL